jgi:hypothetical protein
MVDERHSFLVVEETLTTETIAEYRRSRVLPPRRRWWIRLLVAVRLRAGQPGALPRGS